MLPVAIISFNRPDYLSQVLDSLAAQSVKLDRVALLQDGPRQARDEALIAACVSGFKSRFPKGEVMLSESNLGPAINIDRAERWIFEDLHRSVGAIFEDDMVLSPYYIETLIALLYANRDDPRVAYVAAYGPIWPAPAAPPNSYVPMHLNWAFALTKHQWAARKPLVDAYLDIVRGRDYRSRDVAAIEALRAAWGLPGHYTTQDVMRAAATQKAGGIRLNTYARMGRYIGARGLHIDQRTYDAVGFARHQIHAGRLDGFGKASEATVAWCRDLTNRFIGAGSRAA